MSQHCNLPNTINKGMITMQKVKLKWKRSIRNVNVQFCVEEIIAFSDKAGFSIQEYHEHFLKGFCTFLQ